MFRVYGAPCLEATLNPEVRITDSIKELCPLTRADPNWNRINPH